MAEANRRFLCTGMTTNGTQPLDAPTGVLWVSVDGFSETHNDLRGGDDINYARCGFSPHTEASLAYQGKFEAILAGLRIFF